MADSPYVSLADISNHVADVRLCRPPNNFFSTEMISELADILEDLDSNNDARVVVLGAEGKHFCAGADFSGESKGSNTAHLYEAAARLFRTRKPIIAAVHGAAIGGGLGVALAADFRIASTAARLSANFARLGFHHGFGLSVTLPELIGKQKAADLLFTGRRVTGEEALDIGLVDQCVQPENLLTVAHAFATEIALSAPLAVESIRATLRGDIATRIVAATSHEMAEQEHLRATADFKEGTRAMAERRAPIFKRN